MAGFRPDEGDLLAAQLLLKRDLTDRDATLELGLFTDAAPGATITEATITEPTGGSYGRITLTDANWSSANPMTYAQQTFTAIGSAMSGSIQGYFICSVSAGGTKRLLVVEVDAAGPYTLAEDASYKITPSNTFA